MKRNEFISAVCLISLGVSCSKHGEISAVTVDGNIATVAQPSAKDLSRYARNERFAREMDHLYEEYMKELSVVISRAERAELVVLDPNREDAEHGFDVAVQDKLIAIKARFSIGNDDLERIKIGVIESLQAKGEGAFCHIPREGLIFYGPDEDGLQISICRECLNCGVPVGFTHSKLQPLHSNITEIIKKTKLFNGYGSD